MEFKHILTKCRGCGGVEFGTGIQDHHAKVVPNKLLSLRSSKVYYVICTNCGLIQFEFVEKPEIFKTKK